MNNNLLAGLIVVGVVVLGSVALVVYGTPGNSVTTTTATTTPSTSSSNEPETFTTTTTTTTTTTATMPTATTGTLVVASNSTAVVTGRVTPNGAQTSYWYDYGRTNALGARASTQPVGSGYVSIPTPAIISALSANTLYYYRLSAQNINGTAIGQVYSFTTNSNPPLQGIGPTTRTDAASAVTRTTVNLNGQITPNSSDTTYWFEYGETNELGNTTAFQSAGNGTITKAVSTALSGLKPLTKYYFRLNAQNQFGTMTGGTISFTTAKK